MWFNLEISQRPTSQECSLLVAMEKFQNFQHEFFTVNFTLSSFPLYFFLLLKKKKKRHVSHCKLVVFATGILLAPPPPIKRHPKYMLALNQLLVASSGLFLFL